VNKSLELYNNLSGYVGKTQSNFDLNPSGGVYFSIANTGKRGGGKKWFNISLSDVLQTLNDMVNNFHSFSHCSIYIEKDWRDLGGNYFTNEAASSLITVQTKSFFTMLSKIIYWANDKPVESYNDDKMILTDESLRNAINKLKTMASGLTPEAITGSNTPAIPPTIIAIQASTVTFPLLDESFENALFLAGFSIGNHTL
jgi:hypothetical protein